MNRTAAAICNDLFEALVFHMISGRINADQFNKCKAGNRFDQADLQKAVVIAGIGRAIERTAHKRSVCHRAKQALAALIEALAVHPNRAFVFHCVKQGVHYAGRIGVFAANDLFVFDLNHGAGHRGVKTEVGDIERITVPDLHHIDRFLGGGDQRVHIEKFIRAAVIFDKIIPAAAGIAGHAGVFVPDQPMENLVGRAVSPAGIKTEDRIRFFFATGTDID